MPKVIVPTTYLHNPPTEPESVHGQISKPVTVSLNVNILNIDKIDTVHMMFALTMEVSLEWRDHRLQYKNLREGLGQNQLTQEVCDNFKACDRCQPLDRLMQEIDSIWKPTVTFTNAKIGQLEIEEMGLMVRRETEPEDFTYTSHIEGDDAIRMHVL